MVHQMGRCDVGGTASRSVATRYTSKASSLGISGRCSSSATPSAESIMRASRSWGPVHSRRPSSHLPTVVFMPTVALVMMVVVMEFALVEEFALDCVASALGRRPWRSLALCLCRCACAAADAQLVDERVLTGRTNAVVTYHNPLDNVTDLAHHFFRRCLGQSHLPPSTASPHACALADAFHRCCVSWPA